MKSIIILFTRICASVIDLFYR